MVTLEWNEPKNLLFLPPIFCFVQKILASTVCHLSWVQESKLILLPTAALAKSFDKTGCTPSFGLPGWLPALQHPPVHVGLILSMDLSLWLRFPKETISKVTFIPSVSREDKTSASPIMCQSQCVPHLKAASQWQKHRWSWPSVKCRFYQAWQQGRRAGYSGVKDDTLGAQCQWFVTGLCQGGFWGCGPWTIQSTQPHQMLWCRGKDLLKWDIPAT